MLPNPQFFPSYFIYSSIVVAILCIYVIKIVYIWDNMGRGLTFQTKSYVATYVHIALFFISICRLKCNSV